MKTKRNALAALLAILGTTAMAQSSTEALGGASDAAQRTFENRIQQPVAVYDLNQVEVQPEFPGGMAAMYRFLQKAIHYPDQALKDRIQGKVYMGFIVGNDGKVRDAKVRRGVRKDLDAEALRAVQAMPAWSPGRIAGKPVATRFVIPVSFALGKEEQPAGN